MKTVRFPYGKTIVEHNFEATRFLGSLVSGLENFQPGKTGRVLVDEALENPVGSPPLHQLARGKDRVVLIASDHTRPVPSRLIVPAMLREIRRGNPKADITILIATGCHRNTTQEELAKKFGIALLMRENVVIHDCDAADMVSYGRLPSGGELLLNPLVARADLLVAERFIEPHFFAGFSGGRKSVLPGVAGRQSVLYNHNAAFISSPYARAGILQNNPIHRDMLFAARAAKLAFICNVIINMQKQVLYAVCGDCEAAHAAGRSFLDVHCRVECIPADIVVTTNGGYPMDQNIYQAVKGMTAAEATVKQGGVIIMMACSEDGHGGADFYNAFADQPDASVLLEAILATPAAETKPDQWQSQIFARVLCHCRIIYVSQVPDNMVRALHMEPAASLPQALDMAKAMLGKPNPSILAIPDGVSVMVVQDGDRAACVRK